MTELQSALSHHPGKNCAVALFDRKPKIDDDTLKTSIASLMKCFANENNKPRNLHVLVSIDPDLVDQPEATEILPKRKRQRKMPSTQNDVLIQVSAMTQTDLIFALRVTQAILRATCRCKMELTGGTLRYHQEPFGFYHENGHDQNQINQVARIDSGPLAGGSWLLYQLYEQDIQPFFELTLEQQADVMGAESVAMNEENASVSTYPDTAHTKVTKSPDALPQMIRRGFPYRYEAVEGTAFIAASNDVENFSLVLEKMLKKDAMLGFANAVQGGVYFVPPNADWLDASAPTPAIPKDAKYLPLHMQSGQAGPVGALTDYTVAADFIHYINMLREGGLFEGAVGSQVFNPDVKVLLDAINAVLSDGSLSTQPVVVGATEAKLQALENVLEDTLAVANRFNAVAKKYMTMG